jgi:hypothetical protein
MAIPVDKETQKRFTQLYEKCMTEIKKEHPVKQFWEDLPRIPKLGKEVPDEINKRFSQLSQRFI